METFPISPCEELSSVLSVRAYLIPQLTEDSEAQRKLIWIFDTMYSILLMIQIKNIDCTTATLDNSYPKRVFNNNTNAQVNTSKVLTIHNDYSSQSSLLDRLNQTINHFQSTNQLQFVIFLLLSFLILMFIIHIVVIIIKKLRNHRRFKPTFDGKYCHD